MDDDAPAAVAVAAIDGSAGALADREEFDDIQRSFAMRALVAGYSGETRTTVRAAMLRALGRIGGDEHREVVPASLAIDSQDDAIRQAALDALASLNDPAGLPLAIEYTHPRVNSRTRVTAINTVVKLAHHDPNAAFDAVAPLLRDRQRRAFLAAGQGLVDLGDGRGLEHLRSLRSEVVDPETIWSLEGWIAALEAKVNEAEPASDDAAEAAEAEAAEAEAVSP
jgi:HEAT repeat protein